MDLFLLLLSKTTFAYLDLKSLEKNLSKTANDRIINITSYFNIVENRQKLKAKFRTQHVSFFIRSIHSFVTVFLYDYLFKIKNFSSDKSQLKNFFQAALLIDLFYHNEKTKQKLTLKIRRKLLYNVDQFKKRGNGSVCTEKGLVLIADRDLVTNNAILVIAGPAFALGLCRVDQANTFPRETHVLILQSLLQQDVDKFNLREQIIQEKNTVNTGSIVSIDFNNISSIDTDGNNSDNNNQNETINKEQEQLRNKTLEQLLETENMQRLEYLTFQHHLVAICCRLNDSVLCDSHGNVSRQVDDVPPYRTIYNCTRRH
ncbi:hypothetical protein RFI_32376 [Reticulomyxa filosa]|uniref:Uncharacterized protein n=1 Tax=Reticulomyxa filosa TaxID=46433 RepID=X6LV55_RETFI|nr:hypothetical protein RFI_32376 [Reticulomyxa filosa]|eukprot:ETO05022.1 hypothetical protein RFI_32376 [Reticulomyxa filosa]